MNQKNRNPFQPERPPLRDSRSALLRSARKSQGDAPLAPGLKLEFSGDYSTAYEETLSLLESIRLRIQALKDQGWVSAEEMSQLLRVAKQESSYLAHQLDDLLMALRVEAGDMKFSFSPLSISLLVEAAVHECVPKAAYKGVNLSSNVEELTLLYGDEKLLRKMLVAIIESVIHFTSRKSEVVIDATRDGHELLFEISDTGGGITEQIISNFIQRRIFPGRISNGNSIVLDEGLFTARPIIAAHGGRIWVNGKTAQNSALHIGLLLDEAQDYAVRSGRMILVVDDDPDGVVLLDQYLDQSGYETVIARNGFEGLTMARNQNVGLVLLDVMLPGMDGFEVCHRLRAAPETSTLPIVMISAKGRMRDRASGLRVGANEYLTKPIELPHLRTTVEKFLPVSLPST
jgi:two-component system sensor histidine kinase ChiS